MQSLQQRLLKSLWLNQTNIIKAPGQRTSAQEILTTGRLWATTRGVTIKDQNKAILAASQGQPFSSIVFSSDT
jgi:hypothetical protein